MSSAWFILLSPLLPCAQCSHTPREHFRLLTLCLEPVCPRIPGAHVLLHQCYRQFSRLRSHSERAHCCQLETGATRCGRPAPARGTRFTQWGHCLAVTNNGINGKHLIRGTVPLGTRVLPCVL